MSDKITLEHLDKNAYVYIRQSTRQQVYDHVESQAIQRQLVIRAEALGWSKAQIKVIDDDLGLSGSGAKVRPGFQKLLEQIGKGDVGGLLFLTASRLARNSKQWHQMLDICSVFGTLIIDSEGIYDPTLPGDRLFLGMKGSFSEYEVKQFQFLSRAALRNKAKRGALFFNVPAGFILTEDDRLELDPDIRVQQEIRNIFRHFERLGSVNQVYKWYVRNKQQVPVRDKNKGKHIFWRMPVYETLLHIITNPCYAGAYVYPKTKTITRFEDGKIVKYRGRLVNLEEAEVFLKDHFPGYISWEQFEKNQKNIANNANMKGKMVSGSAGKGKSLLAGLIYCGYCGRRLQVRYPNRCSGPYYYCRSSRAKYSSKCQLSFNGRFLEEEVTEQIMSVLGPLGIDAALCAQRKHEEGRKDRIKSQEYALSAACYEAARIERQLQGVEPENRLVFQTLVSRWESALKKVKALEHEYEEALAASSPLSHSDVEGLYALSKDLKQVFDDPNSNNRLKTQLVRLLIKEVWIKKVNDKEHEATIHWHGGVHTRFTFLHKCRGNRVKAKLDSKSLVKQLSKICDDVQIARIFNRQKHPTDTGDTWTASLVKSYRERYAIPAFSAIEYEALGLVNLKQASEQLGISAASVKKLINCGILNATQVVSYAPWVIERCQLKKESVIGAASALKRREPVLHDEDQLHLDNTGPIEE